MFGIGKGGSPWITKQSIYNQFYSDLVTKVQHGIDVPGTTIHVFYATKMGKKYESFKAFLETERQNGQTTGLPLVSLFSISTRSSRARC